METEQTSDFILISKANLKTAPQNMVWIPGGTFKMGSEKHYQEEAPVHTVKVDGFWMDIYTVSNAEFRKFVEETNYVTYAERPLNPNDYPGALPELLVPGSLVFQKAKQRVDLRNFANWWDYIPHANWKQPYGPGSTIEGKDDYPVTQVSLEDVEAYAKWAGKEIPTEAEWEFAARGGQEEKEFAWGDEVTPEGMFMANYWQGEFPWQNLMLDGHEGLAPVGFYPANGYGLFDMTGNVWEWTSDWYRDKHPENPQKACCIPQNPRGGFMENSYDPRQPNIKIPRKVLKGGSHLCAINYCYRYRPAARIPQMIDSAACHLGFRCIKRVQN
jgi:sulfatase modifying factor 1